MRRDSLVAFLLGEGDMAKRSRNSSASHLDFFDVRYRCELVGTLMLVLIGCGSIVLSGFAPPASALQIGSAFGLTLAAVVYSIGFASGGYANPAVTVALWAAGRMRLDDAIMYIVYQCIGGIIGAGILVLILMGKGTPGPAITALGQNFIGTGYGVWTALGVELVATLIFALVILGATSGRANAGLAGLIVGLTLIALHLAFIGVTGLSANPARSLGPAVWVQGLAIQQVWIFIVAPIAAGLLAGWTHRMKWLG
jgi:aquaporin Z